MRKGERQCSALDARQSIFQQVGYRAVTGDRGSADGREAGLVLFCGDLCRTRLGTVRDKSVSGYSTHSAEIFECPSSTFTAGTFLCQWIFLLLLLWKASRCMCVKVEVSAFCPPPHPSIHACVCSVCGVSCLYDCFVAALFWACGVLEFWSFFFFFL
jgi:hypothetical protein